MDWTTVAVAVVGFGGGAATPLVTGFYTNRSELRSWKRDKLAAVLVDAIAVAQHMKELIDEGSDPEQRTEASRVQVRPQLEIAAELRLYGSEKVYNAWDDMCSADSTLRYLSQQQAELTPPASGEPPLDMMSSEVNDLYKLIEKFQTTAKAEFDKV